MKIAKVLHAELLSVYVKLSGPLSVSHIDVKGKDLATEARRATAALISKSRR